MSVQEPDPAAISLEALTRALSGHSGWTRGPEGWCVGPYELIARRAPGLPYELWKGKRCVAALMSPRDAIAVGECLAATARQSPPSAGTLVGLPLKAANRRL